MCPASYSKQHRGWRISISAAGAQQSQKHKVQHIPPISLTSTPTSNLEPYAAPPRPSFASRSSVIHVNVGSNCYLLETKLVIYLHTVAVELTVAWR